MRVCEMAVAQKTGTPNGTLVSGNMDQNLRNPTCLTLSHTQMSSLGLCQAMDRRGADGRVGRDGVCAVCVSVWRFSRSLFFSLGTPKEATRFFFGSPPLGAFWAHRFGVMLKGHQKEAIHLRGSLGLTSPTHTDCSVCAAL